MGNILLDLVKHFGTQQKTAAALKVDQTTVSGWVTGKHSVSPKIAVRIELTTNGLFHRTTLCPDFPWMMEAVAPPTLNANLRPISPPSQSTVGAGVLSSTQQVGQ
ncbi:transcriptional regulator [Pseudomonas fungipugnans]|uniref:transcriptional regulator n=1 Tax=Pseudomonas fungipugnans TaxID=3024217 RepID=UPI0032B87A54